MIRFLIWLSILLASGISYGAGTTYNKIQVKRGPEYLVPPTPSMGEPVFTTDTHRTFMGYSTGKEELVTEHRIPAMVTPALIGAFSRFSSAGGVVASAPGNNTLQVVGAVLTNPGGKPTMTVPSQAIYLQQYATGGDGSSGAPYTGWESAVTGMGLGSRIVLAAGKSFSTSTSFNLHGSFIIEGAGAGEPTAEWRYTGAGTAITVNGISGATVTEGWVIRDLRINGTNSGALGVVIGNLTGSFKSANGTMQNVVVTGFTSAGIDLEAAELCTFIRVKCTLNPGNGWLFGRAGNPYLNTASNFYSCHASLNGGVGLVFYQSDGFAFYGLTSESNGLEGIKILGGTSAVSRTKFAGFTWVEANNTSRTNGPYYQFYADTTSGVVQGLVIENMQFALAGTGNKHIYLGAVGGTTGGFSSVRGNSYLVPSSDYGTIKPTAAAQFAIHDEDPANWDYSSGVSVGAIFYQRVASTGQTIYSNALRVNADVQAANLALGTSNRVTTLDMIAPNDVTGGIRIGTSETDSTLQVARMKMRHYLAASAPVTILYGQASPTTNVLDFGGGSSVENGATRINFYTAATSSTLTGTNFWSLFGDGTWGAATDGGANIGQAAALRPDFIYAKSGFNVANGNGTIDSTGKAKFIGGLILPTSGTPASSSAAGIAGTVVWDASYIYVCTTTNTWKRTAIATW